MIISFHSCQVLVIPSFWLSYLMYSNATGPTQTYAALVYGAVLTGLFTVSTVFHCVAAVSNEGLVLNNFRLLSCQSHIEFVMS